MNRLDHATMLLAAFDFYMLNHTVAGGFGGCGAIGVVVSCELC